MRLFTKNVLGIALIGTITLASATMVLADKKPKGAKATDPNVIIGLYSGKTSKWNRGGYAYWQSNGEYHGIGSKGDWVGIGKWYVTTKSKLCNETQWHGIKDGKQTQSPHKFCMEFVTAPDGTIWERNVTEKSDWYRHKTSKQTKGDTQKRKFSALRKQFGV